MGEKVYLVSRQFYFYSVEGWNKCGLNLSYISFCTSDGMFAALGHKPVYRIPASVVLDSWDDGKDRPGHVAGVTEGEWDIGICGKFVRGNDPYTHGEYEILPLEEVNEGPAELCMYDSSGKMKTVHGRIVRIRPGWRMPIDFCLDDKEDPISFLETGAVIMQNGKITAVVSWMDDDYAMELRCVSAEQMMSMLNEAKENWKE